MTTKIKHLNDRKGRAKKAPALRVLVVENHPDMRLGLRTFFELLDCEACFAEDLASARQAASEGTYDVLLSDISLPDGSGWDLPSLLQAAGQRPPVAIAMSGFGSASDRVRSQEAGFVAHLIKPFPPNELEALLQRARRDQR